MIHYISKREYIKTKLADAAVQKVSLTPAIAAGDRHISFVISTDDVDRDLDRVIQSGWQLENYLKNPVVLWNHCQDSPIGKCTELKQLDNMLLATVKFTESSNPHWGNLAEGIYQKCLAGELNATSVGFRIIKGELSTDEARGAGTFDVGVDYLASELLEFSIVAIPANPHALIINEFASVPPVISTELPEDADDNGKSMAALNTKASLGMSRDRRLRLMNI